MLLDKPFEDFSLSDFQQLAVNSFSKHDLRTSDPFKSIIDFQKIADIFCCTDRHVRLIYAGKKELKKYQHRMLQVELSK